MMMKSIFSFNIFFGLLLTIASAQAQEIYFEVEGISFGYKWDHSENISKNQIKEAAKIGFREGKKDGKKERPTGTTEHYGDCFHSGTFSNAYLQSVYKDGYVKGYKAGAGRSPSMSDLLYVGSCEGG